MTHPVPAATPPVVAHTAEPRPRGALWRPGVLTRTWREYGYLWCALLLAPFAFAYAVVAVVLPPSVAVTVVGLFVAGWVVVGGRLWGSLYRGMARGMLGTEIPAPPPRAPGRGFWRRLGRLLGDAAGWRAVAFNALSFPLSIVAFVTTTVFLAVALAGTTHWFWYRWLPPQPSSDGTLHRGASFGEDYFIDTPPRQWILIVTGLLCLFAWHRLTLGFGHLFRLLSTGLLGPTQGSLRVAHLEQTRGAAVTDADARLRRIERDLHDGTQARLVAVAMQIGDARDRLGTEDPDAVLTLLDDAHRDLKDTLAELREIARGIHPPALDGGLAVALETLAARCPVPVTVDVDLPRRPGPEVETITYFAVAELLTNVVRHAAASGAYVRVEDLGGSLRIRVRDDGRGGARLALPGASGGTGLAGLADRAAAVDGTVDVDSPAGGPTVVTVHLPLSVAR
ncbi:sensor histidine kinase [Cellulomonas triticagri]|uniref:sensor histidine kinase n=1 Tax=Cellulomonas triticagri TaxID=2483352 RepID=UPI001F22578F|nr:sensor histidine kinase [Cellulomonas triticagri]